MQYYAINDASDDFEFLKISFFLYTCNNAFVQNSFLNFDEALNSPIQNRRVIPFFPRITTFNNNDEALKYILNIKEFRNFNKTGHILQIQGNLLLLILRVINKSKENHNYIFKNSRIIGISSKYSPFTIMPKGCELYVSDLKIFDSNPNINKPPSKLLSLFTATKNQQLEPKSNNITLSNIAKECLVNRRDIYFLESSLRGYKNRVAELKAELAELKSKCKPFLEALSIAPKKVMEFIGRIIKPKYKPVPPKKVLSDPYVWNIAVDPSKIEKAPEQPQKKNKGGRER